MSTGIELHTRTPQSIPEETLSIINTLDYAKGEPRNVRLPLGTFLLKTYGSPEKVMHSVVVTGDYNERTGVLEVFVDGVHAGRARMLGAYTATIQTVSGRRVWEFTHRQFYENTEGTSIPHLSLAVTEKLLSGVMAAHRDGHIPVIFESYRPSVVVFSLKNNYRYVELSEEQKVTVALFKEYVDLYAKEITAMRSRGQNTVRVPPLFCDPDKNNSPRFLLAKFPGSEQEKDFALIDKQHPRYLLSSNNFTRSDVDGTLTMNQSTFELFSNEFNNTPPFVIDVQTEKKL
jgi:hypothetical protein